MIVTVHFATHEGGDTHFATTEGSPAECLAYLGGLCVDLWIISIKTMGN